MEGQAFQNAGNGELWQWCAGFRGVAGGMGDVAQAHLSFKLCDKHKLHLLYGYYVRSSGELKLSSDSHSYTTISDSRTLFIL